MFSLSLSFVALLASAVHAQVTGTFPATPLASKTGFTYPSGIPYKVDTDTGLIRGTQAGYNQCNSTTENQDSLCQTSFLNGLDDFCLWAPSEPNSIVGNTEGEMVAWCTKPGRGTRLFPAGALQGVQYMKTPDYAQVVGFVNQALINIQPDDFGGEMDPHGADLRGNPMGGIVFSTAFTGQFVQAIEWHNFMGGNAFCFKVCDPNGPNAAHFCEHRFDRIGCAFNAPHNAQNGTFEACQGDNQDFPGTYTENGIVMTYTQPAEGVVAQPTYTARIPASSNCVPHNSAEIYTGLPVLSTSTSATTTASMVTTTNSLGSQVTLTSTPRPTGTGSSNNSNGSNDATTIGLSTVTIFGVVFAALFLS